MHRGEKREHSNQPEELTQRTGNEKPENKQSDTGQNNPKYLTLGFPGTMKGPFPFHRDSSPFSPGFSWGSGGVGLPSKIICLGHFAAQRPQWVQTE